MTQRAPSRSVLSAAILATGGVLALAGCGGSSTAAGVTQPTTSGVTQSAAGTTTTTAAAAAAAAATCPTAAAVSTAAGVTYGALQVEPPSSGFPQTVCNYSGTNTDVTIGLYPAGTTLSSLTSVATGTLTPVSGLGSQADSTTTPNVAVYVYTPTGAFNIVDGSSELTVSKVEAIAKVILAG
jgi:hypothetical protein